MSKKIIIKIFRAIFELIVVVGLFLLGCIYLYYNLSSWKKSDIIICAIVTLVFYLLYKIAVFKKKKQEIDYKTHYSKKLLNHKKDKKNWQEIFMK